MRQDAVARLRHHDMARQRPKRLLHLLPMAWRGDRVQAAAEQQTGMLRSGDAVEVRGHIALRPITAGTAVLRLRVGVDCACRASRCHTRVVFGAHHAQVHAKGETQVGWAVL